MLQIFTLIQNLPKHMWWLHINFHLPEMDTAGIDGCLVAKHWKKCLMLWDKAWQMICRKNKNKNIDYIIVHVFSIAFYKTGNRNRHNVLWKILYNVSGSCFDTKQQNILPVLAYHYSFFTKKNTRFVVLQCFAKNHCR